MQPIHPFKKHPPLGRGALSNETGRFEREQRCHFDDGWNPDDQSSVNYKKITTEIIPEQARSIINRICSPDIQFDRSINVYRGCEHGCVYCFARPSHCYLGFSAGLDFESKIIIKENAPALLRRELSHPGYRPQMIVLGSNTDPYQPVERRLGLTRKILEIFNETNHPVGIVTKSSGILRDLDILESMAQKGLVRVALSITTLDRRLARSMEPRASTPAKRLDALRQLSNAGVPTTVMMAPIIPALNDHEIEQLLKTAAEAGASGAGYILLRLPLEVAKIFQEWLHFYYPDRAKRVMTQLRDMHGGKIYRSDWGTRMRGSGPFAKLIAQRINKMIRKLGLNTNQQSLRTDLFQPPHRSRKPRKDLLPSRQLDLFENL